jgi:DNA-binding GntR family transcriptional regulator
MRRAPIINRSILSDQVKDYLLEAILAGDFVPGSRIVETKVARDLGISQGPVREALRDLEALGVIDRTPYQGARVRQPSKAELLEAYGIRAELESFGACLAMTRLSDADLLQLQEYLDAMQEPSLPTMRETASLP